MKVNLTFDLQNKDWIIDNSLIDPYDDYVDFYFSFRKDGDVNVEFDNLAFGYVVSQNEIPFGGEEFPRAGISYVASDQEYLETSRVFGFRPNRDYVVSAWVENAGDAFTEDLLLSIPIPNTPFASWSWNDESATWEPPFQPPNDGQLYEWDELNSTWTISVIN